MTSVKLHVKEILHDIREGLGDVPIMEKYQITPGQYMSVLEQLRDIEIARQRHALMTKTASHDLPHLRALPRCYIFRDVTVFDAKSPGKEGKVNDVTESGIQVTGIMAEIGEVRTFTVVSDHAGGRTKATFDAVCRWIKTEDDFGEYVAGYEITKISNDSLLRLKRLIQELTLCD
ncbi:MAG: hypothetical protein HY913_21925 [Desulfomonile tiedjei]|nr:hypothetical protein [Desulfomonile tiedjei]